MPVPKKCPDSFKDKISKFINSYPEIFLTVDKIDFAETQIRKVLESKGPLLVRNFGEYKRAAEQYSILGSSVKFYVGDNEPVVWFWRQLKALGISDLNRMNLSNLINEKKITISMMPAGEEVEDNWKKWGSGDHYHPNKKWRGEKGGRWKLCHIFPASPIHLDDSLAAIQARFVRNFHPVNHFWFASEYRWKSGFYKMSPQARLGEWKPVCLSFWNYFAKIYPGQIEWFLKAAMVSKEELSYIGDLPDPEVDFQWVSNSLVAKTRPLACAKKQTEQVRTDNVVEIKETMNGRFHLNRFGISAGGENRNRPFVIRIVSIENEKLAESCAVTAQSLGIAEKGRTHYDTDAYFQKDFFIRTEGEEVVPNSAIAKRVGTWMFE